VIFGLSSESMRGLGGVPLITLTALSTWAHHRLWPHQPGDDRDESHVRIRHGGR
jgi:hypothetical protein